MIPEGDPPAAQDAGRRHRPTLTRHSRYDVESGSCNAWEATESPEVRGGEVRGGLSYAPCTFRDLAQQCRENGYGFAEFRRQDMVIDLRGRLTFFSSGSTTTQVMAPSCGTTRTSSFHGSGGRSKRCRSTRSWRCRTGPSDADAIEYFAADPDHWMAVRNQGEHIREWGSAWDVHGTWKRWPIILDRVLTLASTAFSSSKDATGSGILRGRQRQGKLVADQHQPGRPPTNMTQTSASLRRARPNCRESTAG